MSRLPTIPEFRYPNLSRVAGAIRTEVATVLSELGLFDIQKAYESAADERLDVFIETRKKRPVRLEFSVWPDFSIWMSIQQTDPVEHSGHVSLFWGRGKLETDDAIDLAERFAATVSILEQESLPDNLQEKIYRIWKEVIPNT